LVSSNNSVRASCKCFDDYHTSTHDVVDSANLECRSGMCCTRLAGNAGPKNSPKIATWAPSHNFVGLYLRN